MSSVLPLPRPAPGRAVMSLSAPDSLSARVTAQAVDFIYRNLPGVFVASVVIPIVTGWAMWGRFDHRVVAGWLAISLSVEVASIFLYRGYVKRRPPAQDAPRWARYYTWGSIGTGLVWGSASMLFFSPESPALQTFLLANVLGMCAGAMVINSYWIVSLYAYTVPALSLTALRLFLEGGDGYRGLAALLLMGMVIFLYIGHNVRKVALGAIRLRFENLDLVAQLREEKERADAASVAKTRFLASASHDLRQPVHALMLFVDALQGERISGTGRRLLDSVRRSIDALNQLLGSLLDISKLDANVVKPNRAHFALAPLFEQLDAEYAPQARAKQLAWTIDAGGALVESDRALLETMLRNLISNAIRYTSAGGVQVACRRTEQQVRIEVADTGIGIPRDQQREIFREFHQLANPERDRSKGLGLGLAIVDRLATLLDHRVELDSEPGRGSRFCIVLPPGDARAVVTAAAELSAEVDDDVAGLRVLVIDDEAAVREGMHAVLQGWGCETMLAGSEEEALAELGGGAPPDVIVADFRLRAERTGADAIRRLHTALERAVPALIVTGDTAPERLREARASGFQLVHKPVPPAKLRAFLRHVRNQQRAE
jgi:signal transduction histidine kinase